jgi:hypothetical protein
VEEEISDTSASADAVALPTRSSQTVGYSADFASQPSYWSKQEVIALLREALNLPISDFSTSSTCAAEVMVVQGDNFPLVFEGCFALSVLVEDGDLANLTVSELGLLLEANKYMGNRGASAVAELIARRSPYEHASIDVTGHYAAGVEQSCNALGISYPERKSK